MKRVASTSRRLSKERAFTLIEMLVVIGVITLLISIILPTLGAAWESARRTKCLNNLRSIGQSLVMYAGQSNGRFPISEYDAEEAYSFDLKHNTVPATVGLGLGLLIDTNLISTGEAGSVFHCPSLDDSGGPFPGHCMNVPPGFDPYGDGASWYATTTDRIITGYSYRDPSYFRVNQNHLRLADLSSDFVTAADMLDPRFGLPYTHLKGYNVLRGDGSAAWVDDSSKLIYDQEEVAGLCDGISDPANDELVFDMLEKALP